MVRIVSLLPSATEIVYALGLENQLVAVTDECDHPAAARDKPVVSRSALPAGQLSAAEIDRLVGELVSRGEPLYRLDADAVRRLQPDLILAQDLCRVCAVPSGHVEDALATLGCTADVLSLDPATLDEVIECVATVGHAAGAGARAASVTGELRARVDAVRDAVAGRPRPRVLTLEWRDPPFTGGHWVPEMVSVAGGEPLLSTAGAASRRAGWDEIADARPDVVVFMPCGYDLERAVEEAAGLAEHPAFAGAPVWAVDATSYFSRPSPRIVEGLELLAWLIHPGAVPAPPSGRAAPV